MQGSTPTEEKFISVAIPRPLEGLFTYRISDPKLDEIEVGAWVKVPFGKTRTHAFVVEKPKPIHELPESLKQIELKSVLEIGSYQSVLPPDVLSLCEFVRDYYLAPWGEVLACAVPPATLGLKNKRQEAREIDWKIDGKKIIEKHVLNSEQKNAVEKLSQKIGKFSVTLLDGVTGSGKTEVYLELAEQVLAQGRSVLVLVPEIALTTQIQERFANRLNAPVGLWHSAMSDGKRRDLMKALWSGEVKVLIGARSAVFSPLKDLGLVIVDEEHDPTFKQEDRVRYHGRDLAIVRGKISGAQVVLGSATPSFESVVQAEKGRYELVSLKERASAHSLPEVEIVSLKDSEFHPDYRSIIAVPVVEQVQATLDRGEQVMIYLNRRGFSPQLVCEDCGDVTVCTECSVHLTYHKRKNELRCHHCGHRESVPDICQKCQGSHLMPLGAGTESLEEELEKNLVGARLVRLDRDQITSQTRLEKVLSDFRSGKSNIMVGTQMLVKGHDFPGVTLVVVVSSDSLFRWPDFRASERAYQVLTQVAGRSGRGDRPGKVLIQTFQNEHPVLSLIQNTVTRTAFVESELALRNELSYPPYGKMARIRIESKISPDAQKWAQFIVDELKKKPLDQLRILGPSPAFIERLQNNYRFDVTLFSQKVDILLSSIRPIKKALIEHKIRFSIDIDPVSF